MADERNLVVLVDEKDRELGTMDKLLAHQNGGRLHRAISIFIFNSRGETMLQQRALTKYHTPGRWTNTFRSRPRRTPPARRMSRSLRRARMGPRGFASAATRKRRPW